jgi:hypothetical protein
MEALTVTKNGRQTVITIDNASVSKATIETILKRLRFESLVKKAAFKKTDVEKLKKDIEGNWKKYYKQFL